MVIHRKKLFKVKKQFNYDQNIQYFTKIMAPKNGDPGINPLKFINEISNLF